MNGLNVNALYRSVTLVIVTTAVFPIVCAAAGVPLPNTVRHANPSVPLRQLGPTVSAVRPAWHPRRVGPHVFYGMITAINGSEISVYLRSKHTLKVEATAAIANGDYSAPLFVGKLVSVDGTEANGVFTADHIFRLNNLNSLKADK